MRKLLAVSIVCAMVWGWAGGAAAQTLPDRTLITMGAYAGVTFNNLFDTAAQGRKGMSMRTWVDMVEANLKAMETDPALANEKARIGEILTGLAAAKAKLAEAAGKKAVREFYEEDQETRDGGFVQELKKQNLEDKGLTIPFLGYNGVNGGHGKFKAFINAHAVLFDVFGNFTYADFFSHTADEPWVTDAVIELVKKVHGVCLFGSIHEYIADQSCAGAATPVSPDTIWKDEETRANGLCCSRTTRKCQIGLPTQNCTICNPSTGACCVGSSWCL